jgi:hypothetical protein
MTFFEWAAIALALFISFSAVDALLGLRRLSRLALAPLLEGRAPLVSIIVAARN